MPKTGRRKHVDLSDRVHSAICVRQEQEKFIGTPTNFIENVLMQRAAGADLDSIVAKHVADAERRILAEVSRQFDELKKWIALETRSSREDRYVGTSSLPARPATERDKKTA